MIKEHDRVALKVAVSEEGLEPGDVGTVVHIYRDGRPSLAPITPTWRS